MPPPPLPPPPSPSMLALTYFDMPGRARVLRLALALGNVRFDDRALSSAEVRALKPSLPYNMVPVLSLPTDNENETPELLAEAQAIVRYIGRCTGAYPPPHEPLAAAMVDEVLDSLDDLYERLLLPSDQEDDPVKKQALRQDLLNGRLRDALARLDTRLQQLAALPYFCTRATAVSVHELLVWDYATKFKIDGFEHIPTTFLDAFPTIGAVYDKVERAASGATAASASSASSGATAASASSVAVPPPLVRRPTHFTLVSLDGAVPDRTTPLRLALRMAGLTFTDERLASQDEVDARKHTFPNGQLPMLVIDHDNEPLQYCAQSQALLRYIGTLGSGHGLYPASDRRQAAKIDEVLSHLAELYFFFDPIYQNMRPDETQGIRDVLADEVVPESLAALETRLAFWSPASSTSPCAMGGDVLTIADLAIYGLVETFTSGALTYMPTTIVAPFPRLQRSHAAVQQWQATHP